MSAEPIPMRHPDVEGGTWALNDDQAGHLELLGWERTDDTGEAMPNAPVPPAVTDEATKNHPAPERQTALPSELAAGGTWPDEADLEQTDEQTDHLASLDYPDAGDGEDPGDLTNG